MSNNNGQQEIVINESTPLLQTEQQQRQQRIQNAKSEAFGLILMTLSALAFSTMSLFVKLSGAAFASFEIVAARSIVQAALGLVGCYMLGISPLGKPGVRKWLFVRGFVGSTGLALFFYSITQLPLADATGKNYIHIDMATVSMLTIFHSGLFPQSYIHSHPCCAYSS